MTQIFLKRTTLVVFAALSLVLVPAALILAPGSLRAQTLTSGDIAGTVKDSSGAVVPRRPSESDQHRNGSNKEVVSDSAGDYRISLLQPGNYTVTVHAPGFQPQQINLVIAVGQIASQNFKLQIAQGVQTVEVMGAEVPLLQTDTSEMSTTHHSRNRCKICPIPAAI